MEDIPVIFKMKRAMSKHEVIVLLELIENNPIITTKQTDAATNRLKEDCWTIITDKFNSKTEWINRSKEQLKLKWDNLKKSARKRAVNIQINNMKTGDGNVIPSDDILDKVTSILETISSGFTVPLSGLGVDDDYVEEIDDGEIDDSSAGIRIPDTSTSSSTSGAKRKYLDPPEENEESPKWYGMPNIAKSLQSKGKKKKIIVVDDGRRERNMAIAKYYEKKTERLDLEIKIIKENLKNKGFFLKKKCDNK